MLLLKATGSMEPIGRIQMRTRRTLRGHLSKVSPFFAIFCLVKPLIAGVCYALGSGLSKPGFCLSGWKTHRLGLLLHQQSKTLITLINPKRPDTWQAHPICMNLILVKKRCTRSPCAPPGWWPALTPPLATSSPAVASTTSAQYTSEKHKNTNTNIQIQTYKYKCSNTHTASAQYTSEKQENKKIQTYKYKYNICPIYKWKTPNHFFAFCYCQSIYNWSQPNNICPNNKDVTWRTTNQPKANLCNF